MTLTVLEDRPTSKLETAQPTKQSIADSTLCVAGLGLVAPSTPAERYQERWFRAWEQQLHQSSLRKTGRTEWPLQRFAANSKEPHGKLVYREVMAALSQAAKLAMTDADARCGRRTAREKTALLYSDFWGRCSHLEQAFNWRDAFDLDVIPKFLLREQAIEGYSAKLQAGRSFIPQGLQIAADLLYGGDIDVVLLGGLFRFYPALGFSEALQNHSLEKEWLGRGARHQSVMVERTGFLALRREEASLQLRSPSLMLHTPQFVQLPKGRAAAQNALSKEWRAQGQVSTVLAGHYPSSLLKKMEMSSLPEAVRYLNIVDHFGDSGGLNPLLAIQQLLTTTTEPSTRSALLSLTAPCGGTWLVKSQLLQPRMKP